MLKNIFSKHNIYLTGLLISILLMGLITLYSTVQGTGVNNESLFTKQLVFVGTGLVLYFFISFVPIELFKSKWFYIAIYILTIVLLVLLLVSNVRRNGAARWFDLPIPFLGNISLQPADLAKIVLILVGAFMLTQWSNIRKHRWFQHKLPQNVFFPYLVVMIPVLFLIYRQPALGTTIIVFVCLTFMFYFASKSKLEIFSYVFTIIVVVFSWVLFRELPPWFHILLGFVVMILSSISIFKTANKLILLIVFVLSTSVVFFVSQPDSISSLGEYQQKRVECWLDPGKDKSGDCFQQTQARIAIGSGQLFGKGFSQGTQVKSGNLPEFNNDFIYSAFAEQYGFIGTIVLLFVYFLFITEIFRSSTKQKSEFTRVVTLGIGIMFLMQVFIHVSMNTGFLPTTGISLPFMSSGGSFMWISLLAVGIVQNLSHRKIFVDELEKKYEKYDYDQ